METERELDIGNPHQDGLFIMFVAVNAIGSAIGVILMVARELGASFGDEATSSNPMDFLGTLTVSILLILSLVFVWRRKRWAAIFLLIIMLVAGFNTFLKNNDVIWEALIILPMIAVLWWLFVGRLWTSFE